MTLLRYTLNRLLQAIPVLIGIAAITFLLIEAMPGDICRLQFQGMEYTQQQLEACRTRRGLGMPVYERFAHFLSSVATGDLGWSYNRSMPVAELMRIRAGPTLMLVLSAYLFALVASIPLGVLAAQYRNQSIDHGSRILGITGVSTPSFWIGIMLILLFSVWFNFLPSGRLVLPWRGAAHYGYGSTTELYVETVKHLLLPMVSLGTLHMATIMRIERSSMVESLQKNYVQLARAYGVPQGRILRKHAFRSAQLPVVTIVGLNLSTALGGSVLIEQVFEINGMGRLLIDSIQGGDFEVVTGVTLVLATIFVIGVIITDISYAYIDPRVSYGGRNN